MNSFIDELLYKIYLLNDSRIHNFCRTHFFVCLRKYYSEFIFIKEHDQHKKRNISIKYLFKAIACSQTRFFHKLEVALKISSTYSIRLIVLNVLHFMLKLMLLTWNNKTLIKFIIKSIKFSVNFSFFINES